MKFLQTIIVTPLLIGFSFSSFAQTQLEMNENAERRYKETEKELNNIYQQILREYSSDTAFISRLKTSERLWIKFRDAELEMKYHPRNEFNAYGSVYPMCVSIFKEYMTRERIKTLKIWVDGIIEGDVCIGSVKMKK